MYHKGADIILLDGAWSTSCPWCPCHQEHQLVPKNTPQTRALTVDRHTTGSLHYSGSGKRSPSRLFVFLRRARIITRVFLPINMLRGKGVPFTNQAPLSVARVLGVRPALAWNRVTKVSLCPQFRSLVRPPPRDHSKIHATCFREAQKSNK